MKLFLGIFLIAMRFSCLKGKETTQPNIIMIYADDLGWNDVSFHGSPSVTTPNIDALAMSGIVLHNYYQEWLCTPSRGSLMTGKYSIRLGLQHLVIQTGEASGLPLNEITLAQRLKGLGYSTHMVGKWHLGFHTRWYTPLYRGFDTFFGYLNGLIDYYDYNVQRTGFPNQPALYGRDLYNGTTLANDYRGQYATDVFAGKAREIILNHDTSKPLFLYLPHLAVHAANPQQRLQAPPEITKKFKYIKDVNRRLQAAMTSALDDAVGDTFQALYQRNMLNNSIVMFISDNGGELDSEEWGGYSTNYPLRGKKQTLWEGGVRVVSLIWSPLFKLKKSRISTQLMHVSDWLPTLYRAAGGDPTDLGNIDGFDMWNALINDLPSPRTQLLHNIDPIFGVSAYRKEHLKVVNGSSGTVWDSWFGPTGFEDIRKPESMEKWVFKDGSIVRDILNDTGMWIVGNADSWYEQTSVHCEEPPPKNASICNPVVKPCLFNITADPCEYNDLADKYPEMVDELMNRIHAYEKEAMKPQFKEVDRDADPMCHNFAFVPWLDPENYVKCDYAL